LSRSLVNIIQFCYVGLIIEVSNDEAQTKIYHSSIIYFFFSILGSHLTNLCFLSIYFGLTQSKSLLILDFKLKLSNRVIFGLNYIASFFFIICRCFY